MIDKEKEDYMRYCAASEKQLISEIVNDLKYMRKHDRDWKEYDWDIAKLIEKWEEKLK